MAISKEDHDGVRDMLSSSPLSSVPEASLSPASPSQLTRRGKITSPSLVAATYDALGGDSQRDTKEETADTPEKSQQEMVQEVIAAQPQPRKKPALNRTPRKSKWNAENILIDSKSPLASANLRSILSNQAAWAILTKEDQAEIISLLPDKQHILDPETGEAKPNFASLMNDDSFRYACASYTENIAQGRHDPEWLASAWAAHERRKAGDFDEFLVKKFEENWETKLPDSLKSGAGQQENASAVDVGEPKTEKSEERMNGDVDELQLGVGPMRAKQDPSDPATREMQDMRMDFDTGGSEDELA